MMSEYTSTQCHYNMSTVQCRYQQQISEEREKHVNMKNNGPKKVEQMDSEKSANKQENMQTPSPTVPQCQSHAVWGPHICGFRGPLHKHK